MKINALAEISTNTCVARKKDASGRAAMIAETSFLTGRVLERVLRFLKHVQVLEIGKLIPLLAKVIVGR